MSADWRELSDLLRDRDGVPEGFDPTLEPLRLNRRVVSLREVVGAGVVVQLSV